MCADWNPFELRIGAVLKTSAHFLRSLAHVVGSCKFFCPGKLNCTDSTRCSAIRNLRPFFRHLGLLRAQIPPTISSNALIFCMPVNIAVLFHTAVAFISIFVHSDRYWEACLSASTSLCRMGIRIGLIVIYVPSSHTAGLDCRSYSFSPGAWSSLHSILQCNIFGVCDDMLVSY